MTDVHDAVTAYKFPSVLFFSFLNLFSFFFFNYLRHFYRKKKKTPKSKEQERERKREKKTFSRHYFIYSIQARRNHKNVLWILHMRIFLKQSARENNQLEYLVVVRQQNCKFIGCVCRLDIFYRKILHLLLLFYFKNLKLCKKFE